MKIIFITSLLCIFFLSSLEAQEQGMYFSKKKYDKTALPRFNELKSKLPSPVYDQDSNMVRGYWKAWELAFRNFYEPTPENGFVSQYIDAAFNANKIGRAHV